MRGVWVVSLVLAVVSAAAGGASAQSIEWEVQDRFRLFDQATPDARERVDELLLKLERVSTGPAEGSLRAHYDDILQTLSGEEAASLRRSNWSWAKTTRDPQLRRYHPDYLRPREYRIRVRLPGAADQVCDWKVEGASGGHTRAPCLEFVTLKVPGAFRDGRWKGTAVVTATVHAGTTVREPIVVEDTLIVGMGDSFISGEGNPDQPSRLSPGLKPGPAYQRANWANKLPPQDLRMAEWWDEPCHRSLLSWPVLVGLYEASRDRHRAVTLAHFGCSGAEADDGIYKPQKELPGGGDETRTQVEQLAALLGPQGRQRPVDRLLLSLGGNDAGFVPVIQYGLLPPNGYLGPDMLSAFVVGWKVGAIRPYDSDTFPLAPLGGFRDSAQTRLTELPGEYAKVQKLFNDELRVSGERVVQAVYPDLLHDDRGDLCRTALSQRDIDQFRTGQGMPRDEAHAAREQAYLDRNPDDARGGFEAAVSVVPEPLAGRNWNFQFQYTPDSNGSCDLEAESSDSEVCKAFWVWSQLNSRVEENGSADGRKWTIARRHRETTKGHGWCVSPQDSLRFPLAVQDRRTREWSWDPVHPGDFDPYRQDLGRWFRTTNDSVLTQNSGPGRLHQGTIHPTFNTHIAYAESVLDTAFPPPRR